MLLYSAASCLFCLLSKAFYVQENHQAMDLLTKLDYEKSQLQRTHEALASATSSGQTGSLDASPRSVHSSTALPRQSAGAQAEVAQLRETLQQEQAKRKEAEKDFHELMASVEAMQQVKTSGESVALAPAPQPDTLRFNIQDDTYDDRNYNAVPSGPQKHQNSLCMI